MRATFLMVLAIAMTGATSALAVQCSFYQSNPQAFYDGPCDYSRSATGARIVAGGYVLDIQETNRTGVWSTITINGASGVRFEKDRGSFAYTTLDLNASIGVNTWE